MCATDFTRPTGNNLRHAIDDRIVSRRIPGRKRIPTRSEERVDPGSGPESSPIETLHAAVSGDIRPILYTTKGPNWRRQSHHSAIAVFS